MKQTHLPQPEQLRCPECGVEEQPADAPHYGLDCIDITTNDDRAVGARRLALRCQHCGFAGAFIVYDRTTV